MHHIISTFEYFNFPYFDLPCLIKQYVNLMQQRYILYCQHIMHNSTKIEFFNIFKNDYAASSYLRLTSKLEKEKNL